MVQRSMRKFSYNDVLRLMRKLDLNALIFSLIPVNPMYLFWHVVFVILLAVSLHLLTAPNPAST